METTAGTLLGGKVSYLQPAAGYRTGIEPVILAAAVPVRQGERVLEAGSGAGGGLLCLGARVPDIAAMGVELDPAMADLARINFAANGWADWLVATADITDLALPGRFDHAFANPPWHDPAGTPSPNARRLLAKQVQEAGLEGWAAALARPLRPGGTLTLILPAAATSQGLAALHRAGCGSITLVPLWPKPSRAARLVVLQGLRDRQGPDRLLPGLTLHRDNGGFTAAAEDVLRHGLGLQTQAGRGRY